MPQHVTCNVREHDVSIIKSRLKLKDCIFFPLDFGLVSYIPPLLFFPLIGIVYRIALLSVAFGKASTGSSNDLIY